MSELSRRGFIGSAAAAASLVGLTAAADEEFSFKNNVPDPLLAGNELPTFKFALEKSEGKVIGGSYGKEATVEQLPISKGIAGVSMRLEPGAIRELHWHARSWNWVNVLGLNLCRCREGPDRPRRRRPGGLGADFSWSHLIIRAEMDDGLRVFHRAGQNDFRCARKSF